jgi:hypothetical protein
VIALEAAILLIVIVGSIGLPALGWYYGSVDAMFWTIGALIFWGVVFYSLWDTRDR